MLLVKQTYGDFDYEPEAYVMPVSEQSHSDATVDENKRLIDEIEKLYAELEKAKAAALSATINANIKTSERKTQANKVASKIKLSEAETRSLIDEQLREVGWEADLENLRYSRGIRPQKRKNLVIAEYIIPNSNWGEYKAPFLFAINGRPWWGAFCIATQTVCMLFLIMT